MQESPKVFCALYGAFQGSKFGFHTIRGPLMLSVGTLRDPQFSKKDNFLSFVCQMLPRMADHGTYQNIFYKNTIFRDTSRKSCFRNYSVNKDITRKCIKLHFLTNANKNGFYLAMRGSPLGPIAAAPDPTCEPFGFEGSPGSLFLSPPLFQKGVYRNEIRTLADMKTMMKIQRSKLTNTFFSSDRAETHTAYRAGLTLQRSVLEQILLAKSTPEAEVLWPNPNRKQ